MDYKESLKKRLQNPDFKREWDESELEYQIQSAFIKARMESHMTQAELSAKSGIRQSNISRIESGSVLPRLDTLQTLANALGKKLTISLT